MQGLLVSQYMDNQTTEESVDNNKHAKETLAITVSQCHRDYSNLSASVIHEASNEQHPVGSGLNDWMNLSLHVFHILIGLFIFVNYVK